MSPQAPHDARPPFAAYGPATAGYGLDPRRRPGTAPRGLEPGGSGPGGQLPGRPAPGAPTPGGPRRPGGLGIAALALACVGALIAVWPWGLFLAWMPLGLALILGIAHLVRRGSAKGSAATAVGISSFCLVVCLVWALTANLFGGSSPAPSYDPPVGESFAPVPTPDGSLTAPDAGAPPLAWATPTRVLGIPSGSPSEQDLWTVSVAPPVDITAAALEAGTSLTSGAAVAIPVTLTNASDRDLDLAGWEGAFSTDFVLADGSWATRTYIDDLQRTYPARWSLERLGPGESVTYYDTLDATPADAAAGTAQLYLYADGGGVVSWAGPLP